MTFMKFLHHSSPFYFIYILCSVLTFTELVLNLGREIRTDSVRTSAQEDQRSFSMKEVRGQRGITRKWGKTIKMFWFWFEAFRLNSEKVRLYEERRGREAAMPNGTYSSPPFSPCAPFCTAPWVWLSGPGPRPRPQKSDLGRLFLHKRNKTRPRGCWGTAQAEEIWAWQTLPKVSQHFRRVSRVAEKLEAELAGLSWFSLSLSMHQGDSLYDFSSIGTNELMPHVINIKSSRNTCEFWSQPNHFIIISIFKLKENPSAW